MIRMTGKLRGRRGSVLIEGAIIFPIAVLLVMSVIYLLMDFYGTVLQDTMQDNRVFAEGFDEGKKLRGAEMVGDIIHE